MNGAVLTAPEAKDAARRAARDAERAPCRHCGLPLPRAKSEELGPFCCAGCKAVHALIHTEGLERYYDLRPGAEAPPPALRPDSHAWLEPMLATAATEPGAPARLTLDVQGVHCAACVWLLQELWSRQRGGIDLRINPALGRAELAWRAGELDVREWLRSAERFGYRFGPPRKGDLATSRDLVVRLGVCAAAALNVMIFSLCYYAGLAPEDGALYAVLGRWSFALSTLAVAVGGSLFFRAAWQGLRRGVAHLDLPIALGIALGWGGSVWAWWTRGPEAAYFDTITIFVALMVLGRWLSQRVLQRNRQALLASDGVDDLYTRRRRAGALETVAAAAVEPGDELWILPGDLVPVEGTVLGERATLSLDWITGESRPRAFEPGATVPAGAFHAGDTTLRLAAREGFAASRLHGLIGGAREAAERGERAGRPDGWWGRVATVYVVCVLALAALALAVWWRAGVEQAASVALSVLVVTCPCALGLATPLAHEIVHTALRRRGVFLREPGFLQRVLRVRHVLFDKTGTLTRGTLRLSARSATALERLDPAARAVLENACARSLHPVSRCVHAHLSAAGRTALLGDLTVREHAGAGLEIAHGGAEWRVGTARFALGASGPAGTCFTRDGALLLALEVEEELKPDARDEVARLEAEGQRVHVLSGDRLERARVVGEALGVAPERVHGALSPEDKARYVRGMDRHDTWMVGDGINDAPAFDAAFCAATPAVDRPHLPARADLYYLGDGIAAVRATLGWAARLARVQRTNLLLAAGYNALAVTLCLSGHVGPLLAAILMPASSLLLIGLTTLRLSPRRAAWTS